MAIKGAVGGRRGGIVNVGPWQYWQRGLVEERESQRGEIKWERGRVAQLTHCTPPIPPSSALPHHMLKNVGQG